MPIAQTVFVVDDDTGVRELICTLAASVDLPSEAHPSAQDFLAAHDPGRPGCLVLDVRLPGMSGLELQEELARRRSRLPIILVTAFGDVPTAVRAFKGGAVDFIEKPFSGQVLIERIQHALDLSAARTRRDAERAEVDARIARLTPREREVMALVVEGKTNKTVAATLGIHEKTVEVHRAHVMVKLRVGSLAELVRLTALPRAS